MKQKIEMDGADLAEAVREYLERRGHKVTSVDVTAESDWQGQGTSEHQVWVPVATAEVEVQTTVKPGVLYVDGAWG